MAKNEQQCKIISTRMWEVVNFLIKESSIVDKEEVIKVSITKEDLAYITLFFMFYTIENDVYSNLEHGEDKAKPEFKLERARSLEKFERFLKLSVLSGFDERSLSDIAKIRYEIDFSELRKVNDVIRSFFGDEIKNTIAPQVSEFLNE